jgi:hypothetical protein
LLNSCFLAVNHPDCLLLISLLLPDFYINLAVRFYFTLLLLLCLCLSAIAQVSNQRCKWVKVSTEPFFLDTLSLVPGSIRVNGLPDSLGNLKYDINSSQARFTEADSVADSVLVCYRVFPYRFDKQRFHRDIALYDSNAYFRDTYGYKIAPEIREQLFSADGLNKNGSISRGISFGNNQNVFVNSALNLQLEGKLTDNINITAVISDQSIPFQPEGNTQQLQEFDKVYIQLSNEKNRLIAGDVVMQNRPSAFLRYYKNVQGGMFAAKYSPFKGSTAETVVSAAVAKGKFHSTQVPVQEGVQGPYRLNGPNNETFIIVLANSERVFLDGQLLERGFNNDYVIDYNQGEITFTNTVIITKFSRVRIDFEYAERNYGRTNLNLSHYQSYKNLNFFFNHYQESDNPNNPLSVELDTSARMLLSEIGDDLNKAVISGASPSEFSENQVLYIRKDTLLEGGIVDSIFVYAAKQAERMYQVAFSDVGPGKGAYELLPAITNGRIFRWVGQGNGRYLPVRAIATPNRRAMTTVGANYNLTERDNVYTELALSNFDKNRFSGLDGEDDKGGAFKVGYINKGRPISLLEGYNWTAGVDYEFLGKNFSAIDRFRAIEFDRDWSANDGDTLKAGDHLINVIAGIVKDPANQINYNLSIREKGSNVNGSQQRITATKTLGRLQITSDAFVLRNSRGDARSAWERLSVNTSYHTKYLIPGYAYAVDKNKVFAAETDSVVGTAMNFSEHKVYLRSSDTATTKFHAEYSIRDDNAPREGRMERSSIARTANAGLNTRIRNQELALAMTYRNLENLMPGQESLNERTVMGRLDWNAEFLQRHIKSELTFTSATGRELKREFRFIKAYTPGQGTHEYLGDLNNNEIQELDEFVESVNPAKKDYIKIFVPTNEYVRAYTNNLNYRLNITAPRMWISEKGWKGFIARFSNISSWTSDKKITSDDVLDRFVPFRSIADEELLSIQQQLRSGFFFNRTNPRYGLDFNIVRGTQKQLLTNGFEIRQNQEERFNSRVNIKRVFNMQTALVHNMRGNQSDFLSNRNYTIESYRAMPELAFQPIDKLRLTGMLSYAQKKNIYSAESNERATFSEAGLDARITKVSVRTINANIKYIRIAYVGEINSPLGYEMLEALRPGNNYTWSINWQQRLANGLQITINYEGRKSEQINVIHIGRMQVTALF